MTRKILAVILTLAMVFALCLTACGGETAEEKETTKATEKETTKAAEKETTAADTDEEEFALETVDWYNRLDMSTKQDWTDYVWPEMQRYFLEQLNVQVEYHGFATSDYATKFQAAITSNTGIDLMALSAGLTGFYVWYERNALEPLDDLLAEYAPQIIEDMPGYAFAATTVNGSIYGIPTIKDLAIDNGHFYNVTMLENTGLTDEFNAVDYYNAQDFSDFYYDLIAARNELKPELADYPLLKVNTTRFQYIKSDDIVSNLLVAKIDGISAFENESDIGCFSLYTTQDYSDYIHLIHTWVEDNINPYDSSNYDSESLLQKEGTLFGWYSYGEMCANPDKYAEYGWELALRHPNASFTYTGYPLAAFTGINAFTTAEKKVAAIRVYNVMAEDPYIITTMHCGVEGVHWEKMTDEAGRTRANFDFEGSRNADPANYGYKQWFFYTTGNLLKVYVPSDEGGDFVELMEQCNANALTSNYMGFLFATTNSENEIAACANVVGEYSTDLAYGMIDEIDARIDAFNAALEANGLQAIMDDANAQMADWLAAQ